jgi:hypothetical protein
LLAPLDSRRVTHRSRRTVMVISVRFSRLISMCKSKCPP